MPELPPGGFWASLEARGRCTPEGSAARLAMRLVPPSECSRSFGTGDGSPESRTGKPASAQAAHASPVPQDPVLARCGDLPVPCQVRAFLPPPQCSRAVAAFFGRQSLSIRYALDGTTRTVSLAREEDLAAARIMYLCLLKYAAPPELGPGPDATDAVKRPAEVTAAQRACAGPSRTSGRSDSTTSGTPRAWVLDNRTHIE